MSEMESDAHSQGPSCGELVDYTEPQLVDFVLGPQVGNFFEQFLEFWKKENWLNSHSIILL